MDIRTELGDFPHTIIGNENDLRRVLNNLIGNALKFTKKGYVIIKTEQENGDIKVIVKDTGRGIPASRIEDICTPFMYREESCMDRIKDGEGTGLGLPIVRDIVEAHKGKIWVESIEGKGTSFYFILKQSEDRDMEAL